ncbi:hypothetical protein LEMLEM_LOCUS14608 [Lemmus lemmus]
MIIMDYTSETEYPTSCDLPTQVSLTEKKGEEYMSH